ncbi:MAG: aspartate/glutamate racemase family protein [Oscillospiraceae bacterium]|nr:aspartate/glutamate racemase family protein [Oscillospiraceae bacterium]
MKIGVIAGTPVDTQMGIDYAVSQGFEAIGFACSKDPREQTEMQVLYKEQLLQVAIKGCLNMIKNGAEGIFVYCNSLSAAIDIDRLKAALPVCTVTPLDVYKLCAKEYGRLSVFAANCQSLAGIEKVILAENPRCCVFGAGILPVVFAIEDNITSSEIYEKYHLRQLCDSFVKIGCDAIILGCTHFPYIEKEIRENVDIEVINPSRQMLDILENSK